MAGMNGETAVAPSSLVPLAISSPKPQTSALSASATVSGLPEAASGVSPSTRPPSKHHRSSSSKGSGSASLIETIGGSLPNLFGGGGKFPAGSSGSNSPARTNDSGPGSGGATGTSKPANGIRSSVFSGFMSRSRRSISVGGPIGQEALAAPGQASISNPRSSKPPSPGASAESLVVPSLEVSRAQSSPASGVSGSTLEPGEPADPEHSASGADGSMVGTSANGTSNANHHFRRSYSTSSIRMMTRAEVGPSDFVKVRLLGKGDVGKVYLVVSSPVFFRTTAQ